MLRSFILDSAILSLVYLIRSAFVLMATDNEESNLVNGDNSNPDDVRFDLDGSQHLDESDASLDEVDEFLELSTLSHLRSSSSAESASNFATNGSGYNMKHASINELHNEKSKLQRYTR